MRTAIFITARTKSTRLPKKILLEIKGKKVIEHLIDRVKLAKLPDLIVLCTSTNPNDAVLIDIAKKNGVCYFAGSEDDVIDRFSKAADKFNVEFLVVTWGDELFCDPEYIDKMIEFFKKTNADFITCDELPLGTFTYGLKVKALKRVCEMKTKTDTEVWGGYFTKGKIFDVKHLPVNDPELKHPEVRITLDYPEDFALAKEIFNRLYKNLPSGQNLSAPNSRSKKGKVFSLREILQLLKEYPELQEINKHCQELYEKRIKEQGKI